MCDSPDQDQMSPTTDMDTSPSAPIPMRLNRPEINKTSPMLPAGSLDVHIPLSALAFRRDSQVSPAFADRKPRGSFMPISIDGTPTLVKPRGSLASRRSSTQQHQFDRSHRPSTSSLRHEVSDLSPTRGLSLQPPKLDTAALRSMESASPISASHLPRFNHIFCFKETLEKRFFPHWLHRIVVKDGEKAYTQMRSAFKKIEKWEGNRLHRSPYCHAFTCHAANSREALPKNRYPDIVPFDHHRVVLLNGNCESTPVDTAAFPHVASALTASPALATDGMTTPMNASSPRSTTSDQTPIDLTPNMQNYINASWITSPFHSKVYIACQGPLPNTTADFWQMTWERQVRIIVMLTLEEEKGRVKCYSYWPKMIEDTMNVMTRVGLLQLECVEEMSLLDDELTLRKIKITNRFSGESRIIHHVHFLAWPDHNVGHPESVLKAVDFVQHLEEQVKGDMQGESQDIMSNVILKRPPTVVHCSAGCGRSGTYCTIDTLSTMLQHDATASLIDDSMKKPDEDESLSFEDDWVYQVVNGFREQRVSMVQTLEQFIFCYEVITRRVCQLASEGKQPWWPLHQDSSSSEDESEPLVESMSNMKVDEDPPKTAAVEKTFDFPPL